MLIGKLTGTVAYMNTEFVLVDVGGVGYRVIAPLAARPGSLREGDPVSLFIHTHVREDAISLYGFFTVRALETFEKLIGVNGVGPKLAQSILAVLTVDEFQKAVVLGDAGRLTTVSGVGKKTAERIILELKGKLAEEITTKREIASAGGENQTILDAYEALLALGYSQAEAKAALDKVTRAVPIDATSSEIVRLALKCI